MTAKATLTAAVNKLRGPAPARRWQPVASLAVFQCAVCLMDTVYVHAAGFANAEFFEHKQCVRAGFSSFAEMEAEGAGRRLAAVRGGHYVPAPAGQPHGPRRCGGPEHHGVFSQAATARLFLVPAPVRWSHLRLGALENQYFLNQRSRIAWIKVNFGKLELTLIFCSACGVGRPVRQLSRRLGCGRRFSPRRAPRPPASAVPPRNRRRA